ncbi:ABC transporter substrate-binding protein [Microbacterium oryzae]|uniref:ABC transporter substrate-binding protein n=1 Tax=Microbacterium oryzae TaxID=743009 RepID=UPI0025B01AB0|nr:ABC transporter substrate-binding protein [Microbacterium oryzae]MDN3311597.1 ABC transporter substrate-binding protein [Microbacterium oryzae]
MQQEDSAATETATPVEGGTLAIAQSGDLQPANLLAGRAGNAAWASNVYETLTKYDADMQPQPLLATEWTVADDSMSIDITLRDDVTFHSGRTMTADDVKFSIEAAADPQNNSQVGFIARTFESIDVTSPTTLTINFSAPTPTVFDLFEYAYIVDPETFAGVADGSQLIGTGPFTFESWSPGSEAKLARYDDYWGEKPHLDGIEVAIISDSTAMLNAVRSDRTDIAMAMNPIDVQSLASNSAYNIVDTVSSAYPFGVNTTQAPFDKKEARQAVQYAIDRERIASQVFGDAARPVDLFWEPSAPGYPEDLAEWYSYDPEKAKQLLEEAGAVGASVEVTVIGLPSNTSLAEIVRNNLEEVGLKPTITVQDPTTWDQNQVAGELGQSFLPLHGTNGLGPATLLNVLPSLREGNPSKFWPEEYVELRDALTTATDDDYEDALHALSEYILEEAFTSVVVMVVGQMVESVDVHDASYTARGYLYAGTAFIDE